MPVSVSLCICISLYLYLSVSVSLCICISMYLYFFVSVFCSSLFLSISTCVYQIISFLFLNLIYLPFLFPSLLFTHSLCPSLPSISNFFCIFPSHRLCVNYNHRQMIYRQIVTIINDGCLTRDLNSLSYYIFALLIIISNHR